MTQRIYVDFNTMATDPKERVFINVQFQPDLVRILRPGMSVTLYDEEMEVEALVEFDSVNLIWQGRPNWTTCRDVSCVSGKASKSA